MTPEGIPKISVEETTEDFVSRQTLRNPDDGGRVLVPP